MDDPDLLSGSRADPRPRWRDERLGEPRPVARPSGTLVPVVLWGCSATLALVSPFLQLFVVGIPTARGRRWLDGVDGWGRMNPIFGLRAHEPRIGIALWACALGLGWLAIQRGRTLRRADPGLDALTAAAAVGVPCFLAGVNASLVLSVQNYTDRFSAIPARGGGDFHARWGWGLGLASASLLLAVAATCILFWPGRPTTGDEAPDVDERPPLGRASRQ